MMETTKAKINLREGLIELEGSEGFVQKNLDTFKEKIFKSPINLHSINLLKQESRLQKGKPQKKSSAKIFQKNPDPISFDTKEDNSKNKPSLKGFIDEKKPQSNKETLICIALYLKKYLSLEEFKEGHVSYAYLNLKIKRPAAFHQFFIDTKNQFRWIIPGENGSDTWKLYQIGEDYVEQDLPKKQEDEKK